MLKKYWDIISGVASGVLLAVIAKFNLESIQLYYSIIILVLVSIGVFKIIKQTVDKQKERKQNIIDNMVDSQKAVKAVSLSQEPLKEGEKLGNFIIIIFGGLKTMFNKIKVFFDKFKGYMLTIALAALTIIEMCGGFINQLAGGVLTVNGIEILPIITLVLTAIVGILSNGWTKEEMAKIKALFAKSSTNELVTAEIKKTIKENTAKLNEFNKILATKQHELDNFKSELESAKNTLQAKKEMQQMIPQLATAEDVQLASNEVVNIEAKINDKTAEIAETQTAIDNLNTTLKALKSQL